MTEPETFKPESLEELCEKFQANAQGEKKPISLKQSENAGSIYLDLSGLNQVIDFASDDMTVTVQTGITYSALSALVGEKNLHLPVDTSSPDETSIAEMYMENHFGSRIFGRGSLRDYVIGVTAVDSEGKIFHSGGRVVKNVAGYDLCKLLIGSRGTLAIPVEITFKLSPLPESRKTVSIYFNESEDVEAFLTQMNTGSLRPVICDLYNKKSVIKLNHLLQENSAQQLSEDHPFTLVLGFEGFTKEVDWSLETLKNETESFQHSGMDEFDEPVSEIMSRCLNQFSQTTSGNMELEIQTVPSMSARLTQQLSEYGFIVQTFAGNGIIRGSLLCPDDQCKTLSHQLKVISEEIEKSSGYLVMKSCPEEWKETLPEFRSEQPAHVMMKKLRETFDPQNLFAPDELIPAY